MKDGIPADGIDQTLIDLPLPPPPPLGDELAAELARLRPVCARRPLRDLARVGAVSLVYGAAVLGLATMRHDGAPVGLLVGYAAIWFSGFVSLLWLALVPRRGAVMPRWRAAGIGALAASVLFVVAGFALDGQGGPGSAELGLQRLPGGHMCMGLGVATALVPVVLGALVLRGALPVGSRWAAAGLGAAGGSLGGLVLHLHCPIVDGWHLGIAHGGVVAVSAALAAALASRRLT